jgi:hypothetical protein
MRWGEGWTFPFVFVGFAAACGAAFFYMSRPLGSVVELEQANPGWKARGEGYSPIHCDDGSAAGEVLIGGDDAGPNRVERID